MGGLHRETQKEGELQELPRSYLARFLPWISPNKIEEAHGNPDLKGIGGSSGLIGKGVYFIGKGIKLN